MKSKTAPMSISIKIITSLLIILMIYLFIESLFDNSLLISAFIIFFITFFCWIFSPISYEIKNNNLIVHFHGLKKEYISIKSISSIDAPLGYFGIRIGNGGVFSGSGVFWTKKLGWFRAYVTRASYKEMLLVATEKYKIIISPKDKDKFLNKE